MVAQAAISISSAARGATVVSVTNGRLRSRECSVISYCQRCKPRLIRQKNRETAFAGIPFPADLVLDRQAAGSSGAVPRVFLISRLRLVDLLDDLNRCILRSR